MNSRTKESTEDSFVLFVQHIQIIQMELPSLPLNLKIQMGQEQKQNQQSLGHIHIVNYGSSEINKFKEKAKFNEEIGQDIVTVFKYSVQPGRQYEAKCYFEAAVNQSIDGSTMSPLQMITKNPKSKGTVEVKVYPGEVIVSYRFLNDEIDEQLRQYLLSHISKFHTLTIDIVLKGFVSHTLKNRANVKVNYAKIQFTSDHADSTILTSVLNEINMFPPEIIDNPFYSSFGRAKKLNLALKFKGFREMNKYYDSLFLILGKNYKKQEKEDFKYINQGLFREKVEAYIFSGNDFVITGDLTHHGEDAFMRLIKVYFKAGKSILNG